MQPLSVAALAVNIPGPLAARALAQAGAHVVKVEPPGGDPLAAAAPEWYGRITEAMEVERLDLKQPASRARLDSLVTNADVLVTAMRPAALSRLGLEHAPLFERNPRLCWVAVVGDSGPAADHAGHDLTYQARAGLLAPPSHPRTIFADMFAAERAVAAIYELLYLRERTGAGGFREIAIATGAQTLMDAHRFGLTAPDGPLGGGSPLYRCYRTADGWIALAALEPHFRKQLASVMQTEDLNERDLSQRFAQHPTAHWERVARECDLPLAGIGG